MLQLIIPTFRYLSSYMEARAEYESNNITTYSFTDENTCDIFLKFDDFRNERNLKSNRVGADFYWLVDDEKDYFIGEITIRHRLTEDLLRYGGHIGYGVRYSEWNRGYGTMMLKLALEKAKELGLERVLITCDDNNSASAKVMEKNGFVLGDRIENIIDGKMIITRRYWMTV